MTTSKSYDYINRLTSITSVSSASSVASFSYSYNSASQRTSVTNADGTYWLYIYDTLGQVISGRKYWSDGYPVAGQQFGYNFDNIGNRTSTQAGGDQWGGNLLSATYSANNLNQYTNRTVPSALDITGSATNLATVTVNNNLTVRKENYYRAEIPVANGTGPVYQSVTNLAVLNRGTNADLIGTNIGNILVPPATQTFNYDQDGNTTNDSLWSYVWDGEDRLIQMTSDSTVPVAAQKQLNFAYDDQGRRIEKIVTIGGVAQSTNIFIYDGWNLICELDGASGAVIRNYMWGLDLSGSIHGAGGVGGLVSLSISGTNCFVAYDGNGNVSELLNSANGSALAQYDYSPFGETLRASGSLAASNPCRFSTKYQDDETTAIYYGHRFYHASTGNWACRDPLQERGGQNLYSFVRNNAICRFDVLGLEGHLDVANGFFVVSMSKPEFGNTIGLAGQIIFTPDPKTCPACAKIRLVQTVRVYDVDEKGNKTLRKWKNGDGGKSESDQYSTRNKVRDSSGWVVDYQPALWSTGKASIYYGDQIPWVAIDGSQGATGVSPATLNDNPSGSADSIWEFETCARCADFDKNAKASIGSRYLGCVAWGFTADHLGDVTPATPAPNDSPSKGFLGAIKAFNAYYKTSW